MIIKAKIGELNYGDICMLALRKLGSKAAGDENAVGRLMRAVSALPENCVRPVIETLGEEELNGILSMAVTERKSDILDLGEKLLSSKGVGIELADISLSRELEAELKLGRIDYDGIIALLLKKDEGTEASDRESGKLLKMLKGAPGQSLGKLLSLMSAEKKDKLLVYLVNRNKNKIIGMANAKAAELGLRISVEALELLTEKPI